MNVSLRVSDREDVEAHRRLLVRSVLNPAVEVSGDEMARAMSARDQNLEKFGRTMDQ